MSAVDFPEPLGLLRGAAARAAVAAGLARPLQGEAMAFALWRDAAGAVHPARDLPGDVAARLANPPSFAGLALDRPLVMGIVNCTPDSFSGDGLGDAHAVAIAQGLAMLADGADILDIGGESTRPGAEPVAPAEEARRVLPVVAALAKHAAVSIDTRHAATMRAALAAGAAIVNDVSALRHDRAALEVVAAAGAPVILMHARTADPRTMQQGEIAYADAPREVAAFLAERIAACEAAGIPRARICVDPGIGFGKRVEDNLALIARLPMLANLGCAILVGSSRKGFVGQLTGVAEAGPARLHGSVSAALAAAARGAHILRVHDVAATAQALRLAEAAASAG